MSYDIIGSKEKAVAIIESTDGKKDKILAEKLMEQHPSIKSVLRKTSEIKGKYRKRNYKLIQGIRNTEVTHKEHGYLLKLDPKNTYFSPREATERQRLAQQVKPKENILVMFSGISPISIAITKKQPKVNQIYSVEINPQAHKYAVENIILNKLTEKAKAYQGDVTKVIPTLNKKFDRIIMPLPKGAYKFLDLAFQYIKPKGIIHFYYWAGEENLFEIAEKLAKETAKKFNKKIKILSKKKVLPYGPRKWKIVLDIKCST